MHSNAVLLSRMQFVWVIGWHILLPAFTVGLASFIAFLEARISSPSGRSVSTSRGSGCASSRSRSAWAW